MNEQERSAESKVALSQEEIDALNREPELGFIQSHREFLRSFDGQWVVIEGNELLGHGNELHEAIAEAKIVRPDLDGFYAHRVNYNTIEQF